MFFNLVISNPPYNECCKGIMLQSIALSGRAIFLSLATYFQKDDERIHETFRSHMFKSPDYIRIKDAYLLFPNTEFTSDVSISYFDSFLEQSDSFNFSGIKEIPRRCKETIKKYLLIHKNDPFFTLKGKLLSKVNDNFTAGEERWQCQVSVIRANGSGDNAKFGDNKYDKLMLVCPVPPMYEVVFLNGERDGKKYYDIRGKKGYNHDQEPSEALPNSISFPSKEYAENFRDTYRGVWARNWAYLFKTGISMCLDKIPFFFNGDYHRVYSDDEILSEVGFDDECREFMKTDFEDYRDKNHIYNYLEFNFNGGKSA